MEDVKIFEQNCVGISGRPNKIAILWGAMNRENPTTYMNAAVNEYAQNKGHNQFIEIHMDNPWIRVIVEDINDLRFEDFLDQRL